MEEYVYPILYRVEKKHWWYAARLGILDRYLAGRLPLPSTARVLDVGCGTGAFLEILSQRYDSYGTDISPQAIDFCRQRGLHKLHLGTIDSYPAAEPFDLITMLDVLEHVDNDDAFLRAAWRLLRPGGHLLITVPAFPGLWSALDTMLHHRRRYTKPSLRGVVERCGFTTVHLSFLNTFLFPVAWAKRTLARMTGAEKVNDLDIPPQPVNAVLHGIFSLEGLILPRGSLPVGLSLICLARKGTG